MHQITDTKGDLRHNMALTTLSEALSLPSSQDQAAHFKKRLIEWMTSEHISYHQVHAESFRAFIASCSLTAESLLPKSSNTVRGWIIDEFIRQRDWLRDQLLPSSKSLIHLSFDGWTAPNSVAYLDIVGHFMGADNSVKTVLLGIKHVKGSHTGENLAYNLMKLIEDYQFKDKLGYFMLDNAENMDTAVKCLLASIDPQLKPKERRLRCIGHIINLIAKAFLFGADAKHYEIDDDFLLASEDIEESLNLWRKLGPVGKIHNLVKFIRSSPMRSEKLQDLADYKRDLLIDPVPKLKVINDNNTRWNSTYLMLRRALVLRFQLETFCTFYCDELP